jgi:hypothetical protein
MASRSWEQKLHLTKADAAERQFKQAVRLFFDRCDPASTHALASAAVQIFSDLLTAAGAGGLSRNPHIIVEGKFNEWIDAIKSDENFLKHADRNPSGTLELDTRGTVCTLFECSMLIERVTQRVSLEGRLFLTWAMKAYPEWFRLGDADLPALDRFSVDDFSAFRRALDDPDGQVSAAMQKSKPPAPPTTPYDIFLNNG